LKWKKKVIEADARTVHPTGVFDGALMFAAADVYGSQEALNNILPYLGDNARVVAFGAKTSSNRLGWILNPFLRMAFRKLSFPTTPSVDYEPWRMLVQCVEKPDIEEYFFGWMFLASGSIVR
jgi:hypothetical protein